MDRDEATLRQHLAEPAFKLGELGGRYRLIDLDFPLAYFFVAVPAHPDGPSGFMLRTDLTNYPAEAPTAQLWHGTLRRALSTDERPKSSQGGILTAFSEWGACLYHPIDRLGQAHWPGQHPDLVWQSGHDITDFLETVHGLLDDPKYAGAAVSSDALVLLAPTVGTPFP